MVLASPQKAYDLAVAGKFELLRALGVSDHFKWGEVFVGSTNPEIEAAGISVFINAAKQATTMEMVRAALKLPITVSSWYRSPAHNARIGGAKNSQHLLGLATDFTAEGHESVAGNKFVQNFLNGLGFMKDKGLEYTGGKWTHVDSRSPEDGKRYGYRFIA